MSYFDDASLVMIPSGYKTSKVYSVKPTSGDGDLTFTRSNDTATRVGPDGLIEKVRTNVALYSEDQDSWTDQLQTTVTANAAANPLNGATTADKVIPSVVSTDHYRGLSMATMVGELTASIYVKADGYSFFDFGIFNATSAIYPVRAVFNLSTEAITFVNGSVGSITSVGSGWYRVSVTGSVASSSSIGLYYRVRTSAVVANYSGDGTSGMLLWGCQLESGVTTPYIGPTTSAAVSVGPVANVPRLDYLNSSCPRLLLEPQRTNLALYSEQLDNAAWSKLGSSVSANQAVSPDGYTNGDKLLPNNGITFSIPASGIFTSGASAYVRSGALTLTAASYTFSIFVKKGELDYVQLRSGTSVDLTANGSGNLVNLNNGTPAVANTVQDYGNGWYRVSHTFTATAATWYVGIWFWNTTSLTANGSQGIFAYGAQLELGSYSTSLIPTLGAAVTRGADACSKTGISSLIGQTEGTLFVEVDTAVLGDVFAGVNRRFLSISDGTTDNRIFIIQDRDTDAIAVGVITSATLMAGISTASNQSGIKKIAVGYANNDFVMYVNGVQIGTDTSGSVPACSRVGVGSFETSAITANAACPVLQALLFKTRLTNAQLAELTTI